MQGRLVKGREGCLGGYGGTGSEALEYALFLELGGSHTGLYFVIFIVPFCVSIIFHHLKRESSDNRTHWNGSEPLPHRHL